MLLFTGDLNEICTPIVFHAVQWRPITVCLQHPSLPHSLLPLLLQNLCNVYTAPFPAARKVMDSGRGCFLQKYCVMWGAATQITMNNPE